MFKDVIFKLRNSKKMSQAEFGSLFNVVKQTVSSWEKGINKPDADKLKEIAEYFHVSTDYLLGLTDIPYTVEYLMSLDEKTLKEMAEEGGPWNDAFEALSELDEEQIKKVIEYIQFIGYQSHKK